MTSCMLAGNQRQVEMVNVLSVWRRNENARTSTSESNVGIEDSCVGASIEQFMVFGAGSLDSAVRCIRKNGLSINNGVESIFFKRFWQGWIEARIPFMVYNLQCSKAAMTAVKKCWDETMAYTIISISSVIKSSAVALC